MAERSLISRAYYNSLRVLCRMLAIVFFRIRCEGRDNLPARGAALLLSNHQSYLDPILVGLACDRRLNYLAREELFHVPVLKWIIRSLDGIPIDRQGTGTRGLKETLRRLRDGEVVLIFPEGTRTPDGEVGPLKSGFTALVRRGDVAIVPVAIDGAFRAWPRWRALPLPAAIVVRMGPPLVASDWEGKGNDWLVAEVQRRIDRLLHAPALRRPPNQPSSVAACARTKQPSDA